jgi:NAD(P)-dependent dehydrogenase (short-subunit alcohol dehydrogenase family)
LAEIWKENVAVITGASSGIGLELARRLAAEGAWLALGARSAEALETATEECRGLGGRCIAVRTDVALQSDCRELIDRAAAEYGRIDTLICNAGASMWTRFDELADPELLAPLMQVNYMGSVYCAFHALPHLKRTRGRIVGVSSLTGKYGVPTRSGYSASKHAMAGFFDSLRVELMECGVTVTMVYPGFVDTPIRERAIGPDGKPLTRAPAYESSAMSADECARLTLDAAARRRRELVMTTHGRLGLWLKLLAPGLVDRISLRTMNRAAKR